MANPNERIVREKDSVNWRVLNRIWQCPCGAFDIAREQEGPDTYSFRCGSCDNMQRLSNSSDGWKWESVNGVDLETQEAKNG